jgi:hypothetical protein
MRVLAPGRLSDLIDLLHDHAIKINHRPETMREIRDDSDCLLGLSHQVDLETPRVVFLRQWNVQPDMLALLAMYGPSAGRGRRRC